MGFSTWYAGPVRRASGPYSPARPRPPTGRRPSRPFRGLDTHQVRSVRRNAEGRRCWTSEGAARHGRAWWPRCLRREPTFPLRARPSTGSRAYARRKAPPNMSDPASMPAGNRVLISPTFNAPGDASGRAPGSTTCVLTTCGTASPRARLAPGESPPMIGKLLGHTQVQTTARYAHPARDSVKASASKVADSIDADIPAGDPRPGAT